MLLLKDLPISFGFEVLVRLGVLGMNGLPEIVEHWLLGDGRGVVERKKLLGVFHRRMNVNQFAHLLTYFFVEID